MTLLVVILKALTEVALAMFFGRFILALLAGRHKQDNFVYRVFELGTAPIVRFTRVITPKAILDAHVPLVSFFFLIFLWFALTAAKIYIVRIAPVAWYTGGVV